MSEEKKDQAIDATDATDEKAGELSEEATEQVSGGFSWGLSQTGGFVVDPNLKIKPGGIV